MWKGLARWFKSPIPTDPGLKWGNYYHYSYYCQVIPRCKDSCYTGEGGFPGPKRSTYHRPSQVGGSCSKLERLIQQELKYLGLIWLQHQANSLHNLKGVVCRSSLDTRLWNFTHLDKLVSCLDIHHTVRKVISIYPPLCEEVFSQVRPLFSGFLKSLKRWPPGLHIIWYLDEMFWLHLNQSIHSLEDFYQVTSEPPLSRLISKGYAVELQFLQKNHVWFVS